MEEKGEVSQIYYNEQNTKNGAVDLKKLHQLSIKGYYMSHLN